MQRKEFKKEIKMSRQIKEIHIHCSATREGLAITAHEIKKWHLARGWSDIGYHIIIGHQGIEYGRPLQKIPASVRSRNSHAIAIAYIGGLDANGKPKDTRTPRQKELLLKVLKQLKFIYPKATIHGHRDFSVDMDGDGVEKHEWMKSCPCFEAELEYIDLQPKNFKPKSKAAKDYLKDEKDKR